MADGSVLAFRSLLQGSTVAMATANALPSLGLLFVVYMAVDPDRRGTGAGTALLDHIARVGGERLDGFKGLVWETERVEDAVSDADRTVRTERLRFFTSRGARLVTRAYRQPALDGVRPVPMNLLLRPAGPDPVAGPQFAQDLMRAIYFEKYQAVNGVSVAHLEDLLAGVERPRAPWEPRTGRKDSAAAAPRPDSADAACTAK